jgi:hypothetical protein
MPERKAGGSCHADRRAAARATAAARSRQGAGAGATRLEILVADADDREDRAAAIGLDDRVAPRIEPRAHERLHARDRQFLVLGIGQVDDLRHEVAGRDLVEVLVGQLERNRVVGEERVGARRHGPDFERRIEFQPLAAGNVGQLEAIDRPLRKVVASGRDERLGVEAARRRDVPADLHAVGTDEADLRRRGHSDPAALRPVPIRADAGRGHGHLVRRGGDHAGARSLDARPGVLQHRSGRKDVRVRRGNRSNLGQAGERGVCGNVASREDRCQREPDETMPVSIQHPITSKPFVPVAF